MVQCGAGSANRMIDSDCGVHLIISDVEVVTNNGVAVKLKFDVLGSTDHSHVGKSHTEFFSVEGNSVDKFYNVCEAAGLITPQQRKAAADQGMGMDIDETMLKGKQLCGQIKMEPNMRKNLATGQWEVDPEKPGPFPRLGFRTFGVFDKKAEAIPKDPQFLATLKRPAPTQQTGGNGNGTQPVQQHPQQQAPVQQPQQAMQQQAPAAPSMNW